MMMKRETLSKLLSGYEPAVDFVDTLFQVLHFWDDLIDKDKPIDDMEINARMWQALVVLPGNPFYQQFFSSLQPVLVNAVINWRTANNFERDGTEQQKQIAFVIRSDYANILIQSIYLVGGYEAVLSAGPYVRQYWTEENFNQYLENLDKEKKARIALEK